MFKLEFRTDNAAFEDNYQQEAERILTLVSYSIGQGKTDGRCIDANGNHIGNWSFSSGGE